MLWSHLETQLDTVRHKIKTIEYDLTNKNDKTENFIFFLFSIFRPFKIITIKRKIKSCMLRMFIKVPKPFFYKHQMNQNK